MNVHALTLGRPLTSTMIALATFTSAFIGAGYGITKHTMPVILGAIAAFFCGMAGNSLNDYFDYEIDKISHPERPIPSGRVTLKLALFFSVLMFAISVLVAFFLSILVGHLEALLLVLMAILVQTTYELWFKQVKIIGNAVIGIQTMLAFLLGGIIVGNLSSIGVLAVAAFLAIMSREIVKDIEDIGGDVGRVTLPKIVGIRKAGIVAALLIFAAVSVSFIPFYPLHIFGVQFLVSITVADALFIYSIPIIFRNPKKARKVLKIAMIIAIAAFIIGGIFVGQ